MSSEPLISIVLPTYNGSRYLEESIQSCLDQTYENWELILVDDCSNDSTPVICAKFAARDARIHTIRNQVNCMVPASLNAGFAAARGKLFTWTSDDNLYRPHALKVMSEFLVTHPKVDLVYSDLSHIDERGQVTNRYVAEEPSGLPAKCVVQASFMYRRHVHEALGGYDESTSYAQDHDFWLRAYARFSLEVLHEDLYLYRVHQASMSSSKRRELTLAGEQVIQRGLASLRHISHSTRAAAYYQLARYAKIRGDRVAMAKRVLTALGASPLWTLKELTRFGRREYQRRRGRSEPIKESSGKPSTLSGADRV